MIQHTASQQAFACLPLQLGQLLAAGLQLQLEARCLEHGSTLVGARVLGLHARAVRLRLDACRLRLAQQLALPLRLRPEELCILQAACSVSSECRALDRDVNLEALSCLSSKQHGS